jgi:RHS repeat-associated protein
MLTAPSYRFALLLAAWMLAGTIAAVAQYSRGAQTLRKTSELYDERGYARAKAVTVDGRLAVAPSNGGVAYTYPVTQRTIGGFPISVSLNYCSSVAFTTYTRYDAGDMLDPHSRWARFSQNRPAWTIGVNGFAMQVLAYTSSYHCDPSNAALYALTNRTVYGDSDFVWTIDGYDVCNRMEQLPIANADNTSIYVDIIRLLREDGSVLELFNTRPQTTTDASERPDLYSGYYCVNEANAHGYALVEFDTTYWPNHIRRYPQGGSRYNHPLYPFTPRRVRYFPGDGLEYRFREWIAPYGLQEYADSTLRYGGMWAGPTIFYLDEILSNDVVLTRARRTRHYPSMLDEQGQIEMDSTMGRALFTGLDGVCEVLYGRRSVALEAGGRTVQAVFDVLATSGDAGARDQIPLAQLGYWNAWSRAMAVLDPVSTPYRSFVAYVTKLIDPAGRATSFHYESYRRRYRGFGFPREGTSIEAGLRNWRLIEVDEPSSLYTICYHTGDVRTMSSDDDCSATSDDELLAYGTMSADNPSALNNMARTVNKYDHDGTLLTTDEYSVADYSSETSSFSTAIQRSNDHPAGTERTTTYSYIKRALPALHAYAPAPVFTELRSIREDAGSTRTVTTTIYDRPCASPYVWLPVRTSITVNGVRKSLATMSYDGDTVRRFGDDALLTAAHGWEVTRMTTRTFNPDSTLRLVDTVEYRHFPARDTTVVRIARGWNKYKSIERYLRGKYVEHDSALIDRRWEEVMYDPRVAVYDHDTTYGAATRTPRFGVEERMVTADADGRVLTGRKLLLRGTVAASDDQASPALPLADSVIGRDGRTMLREAFEYGSGWTRNLAVVRIDANGARTMIAYDSLRDGNGSTAPLPRAGRRLTDDDSVRTQRLAGIDPELLEESTAEARLVRTVSSDGRIDVDTLLSEYERSYFGQISAAHDPNGWLTRSVFDRNGRLLATWLPGDFARVSPPDTFYYQGPDSVDLYGMTTFTRRIDTLRCLITQTSPPTYPRVIGTGSSALITTQPGTLYAGLPVLERERCPCADTGERARDKGGASLMRDCKDSLTYPMIGEYPGYRGNLFFRFERGSFLGTLVRLDSVFLRLYIATIEGECVSVRVSIPAFEFSRSYVFNCSTLDPGSGATAKEADDPLHSWTISTRRLPAVQGPYFDVNLDSILTQFAAMRTGDTFGIEIRVTSPGTGIRFASGSDAADVRPKLIVWGRYRTISDTVDYTLALRHVDDSLMTEVMAKTDDLKHTANSWTVNRYHADIRRSGIRHYFGADFRHRASQIVIGEPLVPTRLDTVLFAYTGAGARTGETDQVGASITRALDELGRPVRIEYQDGSHSQIEYVTGTPKECGITEDGQDFRGFCSATFTTDESGMRRARYADAFDRVRREVVADESLKLTTWYDYDVLGHVTRVVNANGDTTRYWYDDFGRVRYKWQPDLGIVSYGYDDAGNVRFSQTTDQTAAGALTYTQYDDLGRVTIVGEATIADEIARGSDSSMRAAIAAIDASSERVAKRRASLMAGGYENEPLDLGRITDLVDGARAHTELPSDAVATINGSLHLAPSPVPAQPGVWSYGTLIRVPMGCQLRATSTLAETHDPEQPYVSHPIAYYEPVSVPSAHLRDFENVALYPHFPRLAMAYDRLPAASGAIWGAFPARADWDSIAPTGALRNLRGHEAAVAWREHGGEPWHYAVFSYDERGRVEALLRYTDNVGFDAVYYRYNALNEVTCVRVADPLNQHATWYGYDQNGKLDSVWTLLETGRGLGLGTPLRAIEPPRPQTPDAVFAYTRTGHVATMTYPPADVRVGYWYGPRLWLDSIVARRLSATPSSDPLFRQRVGYDATGQMITQRSEFEGTGETVFSYRHDQARRLVQWSDGVYLESYALDRIGNRRLTTTDRVWLRTENVFAPQSAGPNRLLSTQSWNARGDWQRVDYSFDFDGAIATRQRSDSSFVGLRTAPLETFTYSYRELLRRYTFNGPTHDWRYRYSPTGEREQKRLYPVSLADPAASNENPWAYYLLGAAGERLAEWHGREIYQSQCTNGVPIGTAWMYPVYYNCLGGGLTRVSTRPDAAVPTGRKEYYVADGLGSTRLVVADGGAVLERIDYDPFGRPRLGPTSVSQTFVGRPTDIENGLADHGVRKYEPSEGRFLSIDPRWESFRGLSPYQYAQASPLDRVDPDGQWDIVVHVAKDRAQCGYGIAVVTNRKGEEVFRFSVRVTGQGRDRMKRNGDTPLGVYDIPSGGDKWITGKSRDAYGPNPRLKLDGMSGEIVGSGRSEIRIHGGRQESNVGGEYVPKENPTLEPTHGCIRSYDNSMKSLKEVTDTLEESDSKEEGGTVTVIEDLEIRDGDAVFTADPVNNEAAR